METVTEIAVDPVRARVYEHGWQSWSPTASYALTEQPPRPRSELRRILGYRPGVRAPADGFRGEGLLAVDAGDGSPRQLFASPDGRTAVAGICAEVRDDRVIVSADGPVEHLHDNGPGDLQHVLARWADAYAQRVTVGPLQPPPTIWCSWYHYFDAVTENDIVENLSVMDELHLPVDVVQLDDGYQTGLGDWLSLSDRFRSLPDLVDRIHQRGRRAGIWVAPFLVGAQSQLAATQPDWLVAGEAGPVSAGYNWGQDLYALDTTNPSALAYLTEVFTTFLGWGFDFFKIDFLYAGALEGRRVEDPSGLEAYRRGIETIRNAIGPAYLLGCGAPILPSVGLFDAMRVSPDTAVHARPADSDYSQPSSRPAAMTGAARAFQHGRFWVNDPDCIVARPEVEEREAWANHIARYGGLRGSSDRLADLDDWGIETTRRLLSSPSVTPFVRSDGDDEPA